MTSAISFVHASMQLNGETVETVNARDLHERLEVRKDFSDWAKSQIERAGLIENEDYVRMPAPSVRADDTNQQVEIYPRKGENLSVGRPRIDYFLSLEAAKHIASLARSQTSRHVYDYFVAQAMIQPVPQSANPEPMFLSDQFETYLKIVEMELDGRVQRLVDLRSLHEKLGVKEDYRHWAPRSLTNSRSVEGVHYSPVVDHRAVPHSSGGTQRQVSKEYYACFEKTKIIAARSNAENSLDICEWLVRVEDQVRQQVAAAAQQSRNVSMPMDEEEVAQLYLAAIQEKKRLQRQIASNVLTPRPTFEENAEGIALQRIKREIAPYLSIKVIAHVLKHFGQKRTFVQYGEHENQVVKPFVREGVEEAIRQFQSQADYRISYSRKTVVLTHDCLLGDEVQVSAEDAIAYLGYVPADFGLAD